LRHGPASINELAARTFTHQSSVSMVVTRLVESRLVTRTAAKGDARRLSVSLTNTGRALIRRSPDVGQNRLVSALKAMPSTDLKSLANQLNNLMQIMDDQREESRSVRRSAGAPA
jgi:DNA-binding MarR family transcriptional regulator